jgi:hypothetical protein
VASQTEATAVAPAGLLKQPKELLAKFNLAINE